MSRPRRPRIACPPAISPYTLRRAERCAEMLFRMSRIHTAGVLAEALGLTRAKLVSFICDGSVDRPEVVHFVIARCDEVFPEGYDVRIAPAAAAPKATVG